MIDWFWGLFFLACLIVLITITELTRKLTDRPPEVTRKIVHIATGIFVAITPLFFTSSAPMLIIAGVFAIVNFFAIRMGKLVSYNGADRISYGTVYYPLAFFLLTATFWNKSKLILVTSILVLALADALAAMVGKSRPNPIIYRLGGEKKTIQGSVAMFGVTMLIVFSIGVSTFFQEHAGISWPIMLWIAALTAVIATVCEAISYRGSDNLTVPLGVAFVMDFTLFHPDMRVAFTVGIVLAAIIAGGSFRTRFLSNSGAVATFLLGVVVFGVGGWKFALPILSFFVLSSVLSKLGKKRKKIVADTYEKSSQRDMWQVWANGGVAGIVVLVHYFFPHSWWHYIFLASVAAATADTWGTEIGVFSQWQPRHILTFQQVPVGTSGGISLIGSLGGLVGSGLIAAHLYLVELNVRMVCLITVAGFIGGVVDSIIGATLQAQYQCPKCNKFTEKIIHCQSEQTELVSGYHWINNDVVNLVCTFSAALAMAGLLMIG